MEFVEPAVMTFAAHGVVDVDGHDISQTELMSHALSNCAENRWDDERLFRSARKCFCE